jgi:hypothetical protein
MNKKGSQIQWTVSLVMAALFTIAIITFAINFQADNDSPAALRLSSDAELSSLATTTSSEMTTTTTNFGSTADSILNSSIPPTSASGTLTTVGPFSITFSNFVGVFTNILSVGYSKIFGSNNGFQIFLSTFIGMIVFITALLIWKTFRGHPD